MVYCAGCILLLLKCYIHVVQCTVKQQKMLSDTWDLPTYAAHCMHARVLTPRTDEAHLRGLIRLVVNNGVPLGPRTHEHLHVLTFLDSSTREAHGVCLWPGCEPYNMTAAFEGWC